MPTLICPHCQTPQAVSDEVYQKNLGKKCRCRQCQKTFLIEVQAPQPAAEPGGFGDFDFLNEDSPAPAPAAPPPAAAKTKAAAKPAPTAAPQPAPADELDFSGLMGGMGSVTVADLSDFASPESSLPPVAEAPEFPSFDDIAPAPAAPAKARAPLTRLPQPADDEDDEGGEVARLPDRPALKTISGVLRIIGWLHFVFIGLTILVGLVAVANAPRMEAKVTAVMGIMLTTLMLSASALFWFAYAELIQLGLGMEARLHEISRRIGPRS